MAKVSVYTDRQTGEAEGLESLIQRFKRQVSEDSIFLELKKHQYFRSNALKRKEKSIEAAKRLKKKAKKSNYRRSR